MTQSRWRLNAALGYTRTGESWDLDDALVSYFNGFAEGADHGADEWVPFTEGEHFGVALPLEQRLRKEEFVELFRRTTVLIDGKWRFAMFEHPHLLSSAPDDDVTYRAVPSWIPKSELPADAFGKLHTVELFQDGERIAGPFQRLFHNEGSGIRHDKLLDGVGELVTEGVANVESLRSRPEGSPQALSVVFSDPAFGVPTDAVMESERGEEPLRVELVGRDFIGGTLAFNESAVLGIPSHPSSFRIRVRFPNAATGWACLFSSDGHVSKAATRRDATVG